MKNKNKINKTLIVIFCIGVVYVGIFSNSALASNNCNCSNKSTYNPLQLFQYPVIATYNVDNDFACEQKCVATPGATYYSYSNLANAGFSVVKTCKETGCKENTLPICDKSNGICISEADAAKASTAEMSGANSVATNVSSPQPKKFNYILLESFPGFFTAGTPMTDLPGMILAIYKFGIWTVGIAGLFMLVVGGFMYMTSAGNTSTAGSARGIIWDALLGIVAALGAYLILYVINPNLTKISLDFTPVNVNDPIGMGGGGGDCIPVTRAGSPGAVAQLSMFGENATKASSICKIESGGDSNLLSSVDKCQDGNSFSVGLFQINMIDSAPSICNASGDIFTTGTSKGSCLSRNGSGTCIKWSCSVKDQAKYNACVAKLQDPATNISIAKQISNTGSSWSRWGANRTCKF